MARQRQIWIGIAEVTPLAGCELLTRGVKGAYVSVLAWATSVEVFPIRVAKTFREKNLVLVDIEDAEPFASFIAKWESTDEILSIVEEVKLDPHSVRYATFHSWKKNE